MEHVSHEYMRIPSDLELEELFQRFIADKDYVPSNEHHYPYLALFLVKKGRIGDFELLFKHHLDDCIQPYDVWQYIDDDVNEYTDLIMYCIVHDLLDMFKYIYDNIGVYLWYSTAIVKHKRMDFLKIMIDDLDGDKDALELIHEDFLGRDRTWYEGEELIYSYTHNHDFHDEFFRPYTGRMNRLL